MPTNTTQFETELHEAEANEAAAYEAAAGLLAREAAARAGGVRLGPQSAVETALKSAWRSAVEATEIVRQQLSIARGADAEQADADRMIRGLPTAEKALAEAERAIGELKARRADIERVIEAQSLELAAVQQRAAEAASQAARSAADALLQGKAVPKASPAIDGAAVGHLQAVIQHLHVALEACEVEIEAKAGGLAELRFPVTQGRSLKLERELKAAITPLLPRMAELQALRYGINGLPIKGEPLGIPEMLAAWRANQELAADLT